MTELRQLSPLPASLSDIRHVLAVFSYLGPTEPADKRHMRPVLRDFRAAATPDLSHVLSIPGHGFTALPSGHCMARGVAMPTTPARVLGVLGTRARC